QKPAYWTGPACGTASHTGGGVEPEVGTLGMTGLLVGFADASLEHNPSSWNQLDGLCPVKQTSPVRANPIRGNRPRFPLIGFRSDSIPGVAGDDRELFVDLEGQHDQLAPDAPHEQEDDAAQNRQDGPRGRDAGSSAHLVSGKDADEGADDNHDDADPEDDLD